MNPEELAQLTEQLQQIFAPVLRQQQRGSLSGHALEGLLNRWDYKDASPETIAEHAVALADAVIARLERKLSS